VPFVPLFPILGILFSSFLAIFGLTTLTWQRFIVSLLIGLVIYFFYGFRKSRPWEPYFHEGGGIEPSPVEAKL
jgi:APA family basic amino acid/polyamine antiporter